jgi:hypothetical protein
MTIPIERTNAVKQTRSFLMDLTDPKKTPRLPLAIRKQAMYCLRHYPTDFDMEMIAEREDSKDNILFKVFGKGV